MKQQGKLQEVLALHERSWDLALDHLGLEHPYTQLARANLVETLDALGERARAREFLVRSRTAWVPWCPHALQRPAPRIYTHTHTHTHIHTHTPALPTPREAGRSLGGGRCCRAHEHLLCPGAPPLPCVCARLHCQPTLLLQLLTVLPPSKQSFWWLIHMRTHSIHTRKTDWLMTRRWSMSESYARRWIPVLSSCATRVATLMRPRSPAQLWLRRPQPQKLHGVGAAARPRQLQRQVSCGPLFAGGPCPVLDLRLTPNTHARACTHTHAHTLVCTHLQA